GALLLPWNRDCHYPRADRRGVHVLFRRSASGDGDRCGATSAGRSWRATAMVDRRRRTGMADFVAKATVVLMFALLSTNLLREFLRTGHITGVLLLASE